MTQMQLIRIAGAGPSGLTAAIVLAKAGRSVEVREAKTDVGARFIGDLQIIESASEREPVPNFFDRIGIVPRPGSHLGFRRLGSRRRRLRLRFR